MKTIFQTYVDEAMTLHNRAVSRWAAYHAMTVVGVDALLGDLYEDAEQAEQDLYEHLMSLRSQAAAVLRQVNEPKEVVNG